MRWTDRNGEFYGIDCITKSYMIEELDENKLLINRYIELTPELTV